MLNLQVNNLNYKPQNLLSFAAKKKTGSGIEYVNAESWNPMTGCTPASEGCNNCYAKDIADWLIRLKTKKYVEHGFVPTVHENELEKRIPGKGKRLFVCSMSDLFHKTFPKESIDRVINNIERQPQHTFLVLTKRSERLKNYEPPNGKFPDNCWVGVTVESNRRKNRIDDLREVKAKTKWISFEPLLSKIENVNLKDIDWAVVGCEDAAKPKKSRECKTEWVGNLIDQCQKSKVPVFVKQLRENGKLVSMPEVNGKVWDQMPNNTSI